MEVKGEGSLGTVYKAELKNGQPPVAIKALVSEGRRAPFSELLRGVCSCLAFLPLARPFSPLPSCLPFLLVNAEVLGQPEL